MNTSFHHKRASIFTFLMSVLLSVAIYSVKSIVANNKRVKNNQGTNFNLAKVKKIKKKKNTPKKQLKRKKMTKKMQALKPLLKTSIAGNTFGLAGLMVDDLGIDSDLLDDGEDVIMDENSVDERPKVINVSEMEFPEKALDNNVMFGRVELRLLITKEGRVKNIEVLEANPKGYFEEVALSSVSAWRFKPANYRGKNVAIWAKQVVKFGE